MRTPTLSQDACPGEGKGTEVRSQWDLSPLQGWLEWEEEGPLGEETKTKYWRGEECRVNSSALEGKSCFLHSWAPWGKYPVTESLVLRDG